MIVQPPHSLAVEVQARSIILTADEQHVSRVEAACRIVARNEAWRVEHKVLPIKLLRDVPFSVKV